MQRKEDEDLLRTVKPVDQRILPGRFDLPHAVAFYFHDELARFVVDLERTGALSVPLDLSSDEQEVVTKLEGQELWKWLHDSGRDDVIRDLTYRQLTTAVLADAAQFICESLLASGKGKLTVAYSLLRKPFKENLLLLEWLCGSPDEFLARFYGESVRDYLLNKLPLRDRRRIIDTAVATVGLEESYGEMLWLVRYGKEYPNSLETLWTKATHLVTSVEAIATEPGNLNFVFSSGSAIEEQWEHYYFIVPFLLFYFIAVAERVMGRFVEWDSGLRATQIFLRNLAFLRYTEVVADARELAHDLNDIYSDLETLRFRCERCDGVVAARREEIDRLWLRAEIRCPSCRRGHNFWDIGEGWSEIVARG